MYVISEIIGPSPANSGLGNQLFCVSAAVAYSLRLDKHLFFPQLFTDPSISRYREVFYNNLRCSPDPMFATTAESTNTPVIYREYNCPPFSYTEIPHFDGSVKLRGYFMSEKYFADHKKELFEILGISPLRREIKKKYGDFSDHVSVHVRRGDYLHLKDYHTNLGMDYYKKAIEAVGEHSKFLVFSDDLGWCKENLTFLKNVEYSPCDEDYEDLILMSTCKHNIIANSTFSWWGAYFNERKEKMVIFPRDWFGPKKRHQRSLEDIVPSEWVGA